MVLLVIWMPYGNPTQLIVLPVYTIRSFHVSIPESVTQILRGLMPLRWTGIVRIIEFVHQHVIDCLHYSACTKM